MCTPKSFSILPYSCLVSNLQASISSNNYLLTTVTGLDLTMHHGVIIKGKLICHSETSSKERIRGTNRV